MKITIDRAVAEQALEALLNCPSDISDEMFESIRSLKAALAEPVQEPPASKPWVGLTEKERTDICDGYGANIHWRAFRAIESKLQEKNT